MNEDFIKYIIAIIIDNANDSIEEQNKSKNDLFYEGKKFAYYEVLDSIKNELIVRDIDLKEFGLDIDLEKTFL
jgi:hypothetical protein